MKRIVPVLFTALVLAAPGAATPDLASGGPITITSGGTYSGTWTSTSSTPAIRITTSEPVVIQRSTVANQSGGPLIVTDWPLAADVTLRRVKAYGGAGRFFDAEGFKSVRIVNCTIHKTSGIKLAHGAPGSSVVVTKNRHRNVQGPSLGASQLSQFLQLAEVQNATVDVSWNEVINVFGKSEVEDVISVYKSAHARIYDNYLQGGYPVTNVPESSANGITVEVGDAAGPTSFDNKIWGNTIVDNVGGIGLVGGRDNHAYGNRIVQDGKLDDGSRLHAANAGLAVWNLTGHAGFENNRAYDNVVGFVHGRGYRNDFWFPDAPGEHARNTRRKGRVTRVTEQAERTVWLAKLKVNRIRVGA